MDYCPIVLAVSDMLPGSSVRTQRGARWSSNKHELPGHELCIPDPAGSEPMLLVAMVAIGVLASLSSGQDDTQVDAEATFHPYPSAVGMSPSAVGITTSCDDFPIDLAGKQYASQQPAVHPTTRAHKPRARVPARALPPI